MVSGPIAIATQKPYLLKLSKTRLVLQQTTTKQMIILDYHWYRYRGRWLVFTYIRYRSSQKSKLPSWSDSTLEALIFHLDPSSKIVGGGDSFWVLVAHTLALLGYSQKKIQIGVVETYFCQKIPVIFKFVTLSLEILEKAKLHLRKFHKIVLQHLGIPIPLDCFLIRWELHSFLLE